MIEVSVRDRWTHLSADVLAFIEATSDNAFVRPAWLHTWYEHYAGSWQPHIVVLLEDGRPIAVAPLIRRALGPVGLIRFAGHGLGNYLEIVCDPADHARAIGALFANLRSLGPGAVEWIDVPAESPLRASLRDAGGAATALYPCPRAVLGRDWPTHLASVVPSKKHRRNLERSLARLRELGSVEFTASVERPAPTFVAELRALHAKRFAGTPNPLLEPRFWRFFEALVERALGRDLRVSTLRLDGRLISAVIGLSSGRTFVDYAPAFDPDMANLMPGHAHLFLLQQALIGEYDVFDFSKGEGFYKRRWSNAESWNYGYTFGLGRSGRAFATSLLLGARARAWARSRGLTTVVRRLLSGRSTRTRFTTAA